MGNKLIIISSQNRRSVNYYKLTADEQALLKKAWFGVEKNPQFHGSSFFVELCKLHPPYTKYFTAMPQVPLTFDSRNVAKFTVIMETIGYLVLDYHRKPKQLDQLVGYIAMVHKDMGLRREDILNFGSCLIQYLSKTFSLSMNDASLDVFTKYLTSILVEMAFKMEEFLQDDVLNALDDEKNDKKTIENAYPKGNVKGANTMFSAEMATTSKNPDILDAEQKGDRREIIRKSQKRGSTLRMLCGHWSTCRKTLIYGQSLHYWKDRKRDWDNRLKQWRILSTTSYTDPKIQTSTSDDEETSAYKSKTEDETASEMTDMRISLPEIPQSAVAKIQDIYKKKDDLKELLTEQKIKPAESINVSHVMNNKLTRGADVVKLSSVPEDANEVLEEISTPRERRRTRSYLENNFRNHSTPSNLEHHDVKRKIPVESQELKDPQETEKFMDSPSTALLSAQSARQRRRESRKALLP